MYSERQSTGEKEQTQAERHSQKENAQSHGKKGHG